MSKREERFRVRLRAEPRDARLRNCPFFPQPIARASPRSQFLCPPAHGHCFSLSHSTTTSFRAGKATDYYGSYKVEKGEMVTPPCDAGNDEVVLRLMDQAAQLGIQVR